MEADLGKCWNCKVRPGRIHCHACRFALYCDWTCQHQDQFRHEIECRNAVNVQTCHNCSQWSKQLKCCTGCYSAFYCGRKCQTTHFPYHKEICDAFGKTVLQIAAERQQKVPFSGLPWYVGASLAEDYLHLNQNEGRDTDKCLRLMFIAAGDIRDVVCTIAGLPNNFSGKLEFVINDISAHVMARNLLFLYCAIVHQHAANLVQIWYSFSLTESCLSFVVKILKELVTLSRQSILSSMQHLVVISEAHWQQCVGIWEGWIRLSTDVKASERFLQERKSKIATHIMNLMMMIGLAPEEHMQSLMEYMMWGILLPLNSPLRQRATHVNPTMACFNPFNANCAFKYNDVNCIVPHRAKWGYKFDYETEMIYGVRQDCYAFVCWDYQKVKKTVGLKDDIVEMYRIYLQQIFTLVFQHLNKRNICFHLVIDSFENLDENLLKNKRFDRICTSNLSDYVPIPRLLQLFGPFLNRENSSAVLISHHQNWGVYANLPREQQMDLFRAVADCEARPHIMPNGQSISCGILAFRMYVKQSGYVNVYPCFLQSYIAEVLLYLHNYENLPFAKSLVGKVSKVPGRFGLRLRDYRKELNRVVPFYREELSRRLEISICGKRCLEWVPV